MPNNHVQCSYRNTHSLAPTCQNRSFEADGPVLLHSDYAPHSHLTVISLLGCILTFARIAALRSESSSSALPRINRTAAADSTGEQGQDGRGLSLSCTEAAKWTKMQNDVAGSDDPETVTVTVHRSWPA